MGRVPPPPPALPSGPGESTPATRAFSAAVELSKYHAALRQLDHRCRHLLEAWQEPCDQCEADGAACDEHALRQREALHALEATLYDVEKRIPGLGPKPAEGVP